MKLSENVKADNETTFSSAALKLCGHLPAPEVFFFFYRLEMSDMLEKRNAEFHDLISSAPVQQTLPLRMKLNHADSRSE